MRRFRINGLPPVAQLRDEMDRLMNDFLPASVAQSVRAYPPVNVWEKGGEYYVEAELPGLCAEDVEISVVGSELTLSGRRSRVELEGAAYHRRERGEGEFTRVVHLPVEVDSDKVSAQMRDGVLLVTLPKAESLRPRKIQVAAAG